MYDLAECSEKPPTGITQRFFPKFWTVQSEGDANCVIYEDNNNLPQHPNEARGFSVYSHTHSDLDFFSVTWETTPKNGFPQYNYLGENDYTGEFLSCALIATGFDTVEDWSGCSIIVSYKNGNIEELAATSYITSYKGTNSFDLVLPFDDMHAGDGIGGVRQIPSSGITKVQFVVKNEDYGLGRNIVVTNQTFRNGILIGCYVSGYNRAPKPLDTVKIWGQTTTIEDVFDRGSYHVILFKEDIYKNNNDDSPQIVIIPHDPTATTKRLNILTMQWKYFSDGDTIASLEGVPTKQLEKHQRTPTSALGSEVFSNIIRLDNVRHMNANWVAEQVILNRFNIEPCILLGSDSYDYNSVNMNPGYKLEINASSGASDETLKWLEKFQEELLSNGNGNYTLFADNAVSTRYSAPDSYLQKDKNGDNVVNGGCHFVSWGNDFGVSMIKELLLTSHNGTFGQPLPRANVGVWIPEWRYDAGSLNIGIYDASIQAKYVSDTGQAVPTPFLGAVDQITPSDITNSQPYLDYCSAKMGTGFQEILNGYTVDTRLHFDGTLETFPEYSVLPHLNTSHAHFDSPAVNKLFLSDYRLSLKEFGDIYVTPTMGVFGDYGYSSGSTAYISGKVESFEKRWQWWKADVAAGIAFDYDNSTNIYFDDVSIMMRDGFQWLGSTAGYDCGGGACGC